MDHILRHTLYQEGIQPTGEVHVLPFVAHYKLIRVAQSGQEATRSDPEDGCERRREENAFHDGKGNHPRREGMAVAIKPFQTPVRLGRYGRYSIDRVEEAEKLIFVRYEFYQKPSVCFGVYVLPVTSD